METLYKFWLHCIVLMRNQAMFHTDMQKNDLDMFICGWKFIPTYFAMHKDNYPRFGFSFLEVSSSI